MRIDAHHHLWDLNEARSGVEYTWLKEDVVRFFGDPAPIRCDYLLEEFRADAAAEGFEASVHIQVGVADPMAEARWVDRVASANPDWPMKQVVFCDLTAADVDDQLAAYAALPSVRGVRQIVGRAPEEDAKTGTNALLDDPAFVAGLRKAAAMGFSFDLQLIPELMAKTAREVVDLLKRKEVSSKELLDISVARIEAVEPAVNTTVTLCKERAYAHAEAAQKADPSDPGYLGGLPISIKGCECSQTHH